jgi:hypothetical protein
MKPTFKAHGTKRLKLKFDILLSNFAFKFNLRRYSAMGAARTQQRQEGLQLKLEAKGMETQRQGLTLVHFSAQLERCLWDRGCA